MKWLYRIVRLFKCPHKWNLQTETRVRDDEGITVGYNYVMCCRRCGGLRIFKNRE